MLTLPTDSDERKNYALFRGCLRYFPAAIAGVSKISKLGNDKHNPGQQEMYHNRGKSQDHGDCVMRHLVDVDDLMAALERGEDISKETILNEASSMAWRALALSQEIHEKFGYPLAPGAKSDAVKQKVYEATDLHAASEKAQEEIAKLVQSNKQNIFNKPKVVSEDMEREIAGLEKPKTKFSPGDVVKHINNDVEVTVQATYYDENGKPILFVKDSDNKIFGVDPNSYKSIYAEKSS